MVCDFQVVSEKIRSRMTRIYISSDTGLVIFLLYLLSGLERGFIRT